MHPERHCMYTLFGWHSAVPAYIATDCTLLPRTVNVGAHLERATVLADCRKCSGTQAPVPLEKNEQMLRRPVE